MAPIVVSKISKFSERIKLGLNYEGLIVRKVDYEPINSFWDKISFTNDTLIFVMTTIDECEELKIMSSKFKKVYAISGSGFNCAIENVLVLPLPVDYKLLAEQIRNYEYNKQTSETKVICYKEIEIDLDRRETRIAGQNIRLRNKEFILLKYLVDNKGRLLTRINIVENVWDVNGDVFTNTVDVHISKLRKIFNSFSKTKGIIQTVHSVGYIFQ